MQCSMLLSCSVALSYLFPVFRLQFFSEYMSIHATDLPYLRSPHEEGVQSFVQSTHSALHPIIISLIMLRYCRNVRPTWVKFDSKDTKESVFEVLSTKSKKRT